MVEPMRVAGLAIDLGMGEGRNAIYLAQQGWQTTGVDLADVAVAQARKRALEAGGLLLGRDETTSIMI
jgi:2-polyprenyl-3-methyl-5-hydroxy-6-metoxy-1,4-benzoquinol methylase